MYIKKIRELLEIRQIIIYFGAIVLASLIAFLMPRISPLLEYTINPALGFMLFVTFLQVPMADMKQSLDLFRNPH